MGLATGTRDELLLSEYTGSKLLGFLCPITSLSIDQVNFIACQIFALLLSCVLKKWVKNPLHKLRFCFLSGIAICYFCFGIQIFHVVASAGISFIIIHNYKSKNMPWVVFWVSMLYLSWCHLRRQFYDIANGYSLDITGPLMVLTQKVTSLAFAIGDGEVQKKADEQQTELQIRYAVSEYPGAIEYWSYVFQFQSMLAGPLVFYKDFQDFINTNDSPSPLNVVVGKLGLSLFFAFLYINVSPKFGISYLKDTKFLDHSSLFYKIFYITAATTLERAKYFHAWILSDAVCNASGLGYNRLNNSWDLVTNVDAIRFEFRLNMKESLDDWNKGTMKWLRYVVYERFNPNIRTLATYAVSAMWHGFYPGYYITFLSGALFTFAARVVRKTVRPVVLKKKAAKLSYDFVTWLTTRLVIAYITFSFVLLDFKPCIVVYMKLYFFLHIAAVAAMVFLPKFSRRSKQEVDNVYPLKESAPQVAVAGGQPSHSFSKKNEEIDLSTIAKTNGDLKTYPVSSSVNLKTG